MGLTTHERNGFHRNGGGREEAKIAGDLRSSGINNLASRLADLFPPADHRTGQPVLPPLGSQPEPFDVCVFPGVTPFGATCGFSIQSGRHHDLVTKEKGSRGGRRRNAAVRGCVCWRCLQARLRVPLAHATRDGLPSRPPASFKKTPPAKRASAGAWLARHPFLSSVFQTIDPKPASGGMTIVYPLRPGIS